MNTIVTTMPIKPQMETNIGMYIAPTLSNVLGNILSCDNVMALNLLNSYKTKNNEASIYLNDLYKQGIRYNQLFIDKDHTDEILNIISMLISSHDILVTHEEIFRCECGKIDMIKQGVNEKTNKLYYEKDNRYYCKSCQHECKTFKEDVLTLNLRTDIDDSLLITPTFLKKEICHLSKTFKESKLLISKQRETGYQVIVSGRKYNIDIDFIWSNYFQLFDIDQMIMIASNHQLYQMYILNYLSKMVSDKKICFVAHPYMNKSTTLNPLLEYEKTEDDIYKKLFILYNLKWRNKNCDWSETVINYLGNISTTRRDHLYQILERTSKELYDERMSIDDYLEKVLTRGINIQSNITDAKKLVRSK